MLRHDRNSGVALAAVFALLACADARAGIFQDILPGGRAQGMGSAYGSLADDSDAIFYNPAGLALVGSQEYAFGAGRTLSSDGNLGMFSGSFAKPSAGLVDTVFGAGLLSQRQSQVANRDAFLFSMAAVRPLTFFEDFFPGVAVLPGRWGATLRVENVRHETAGSKIGLGFDGGVQIGRQNGLMLGAALMQFQTDTLTPTPILSLGGSYPVGKFRLAMDFRVREGSSQFFPGIEGKFFGRLLSLRAGKGQQILGNGSLALGLGVDYSPFVFDLSAAFPFKGEFEEGSYGMSFSYRFDSPSFIEKFAGRTGKELRDLDRQVRDQRELLGRIQDARDEFRAERDAARAELEELGLQLDRQDKTLIELRRKERRAIVERDQLEPKPIRPKRAGVAKRSKRPHRRRSFAKLPARHKVRDGDTLRSIASRYYGDPHLWEYIYNANPSVIVRGLPKVGVLITIPALPETASERRGR